MKKIPFADMLSDSVEEANEIVSLLTFQKILKYTRAFSKRFFYKDLHR